jgi:hypothetical protein
MFSTSRRLPAKAIAEMQDHGSKHPVLLHVGARIAENRPPVLFATKQRMALGLKGNQGYQFRAGRAAATPRASVN